MISFKKVTYARKKQQRNTELHDTYVLHYIFKDHHTRKLSFSTDFSSEEDASYKM
jgi:hypothetical protein